MEALAKTKDLILFIVFVLVNLILFAWFKLLFSNYIPEHLQDYKHLCLNFENVGIS